MTADSLWLFEAWIAFHILALGSACGTRIAAGSVLEGLAQLGFFACMAVIGAATFVCQQMEAAWVWSGITLVLMVILAVVDFRRMLEPAHARLGQ
jgi:hypothetical protein